MNPSAQRRILIKLAIDAVCLTVAAASFIGWQVMGVGWAMWPLLAATLSSVVAQVWLRRANKADT